MTNCIATVWAPVWDMGVALGGRVIAILRLDLFEQNGNGLVGDGFDILRNGRQRRKHILTKDCIVKTGEADIIRHAIAPLKQQASDL